MRSFPITITFMCADGSATYCPSFFSAASTFSRLPVRKYQPAWACHFCAYACSLAGVSCSGSTVIETSTRSRPRRSAKRVCSAARLFDITGQLALHDAKKELITTTLSFITSL